MTSLEYFKQQSKNLFRDWKSHTEHIEEDGYSYYEYHPKFFDVDDILFYYEIEEKEFTLMKAQHLVAQIAGFKKWTELIKASSDELKLAKIVFENCSKDTTLIEEWQWYCREVDIENLDIESKFAMADHFFNSSNNEQQTKQKFEPEKILTGKERVVSLLQEMHSIGDFKLDSKVKCIHCDDQYLFREVAVIQSRIFNKPMIMCKNYPQCDGSLMDLFDADDDYNGTVPFDWDMDYGNDSE